MASLTTRNVRQRQRAQQEQEYPVEPVTLQRMPSMQLAPRLLAAAPADDAISMSSSGDSCLCLFLSSAGWHVHGHACCSCRLSMAVTVAHSRDVIQSILHVTLVN